jgi:hypothetical protein
LNGEPQEDAQVTPKFSEKNGEESRDEINEE